MAGRGSPPHHDQDEHEEGESDEEERHRKAVAVAEALREASPSLQQRRRTSRDDPAYLANFHANSRLHFIGVWRERYEELFALRPAPPALPPTPDGGERTILHVDMDCFFASVAAAGRPALARVPLAVTWASGRAAASSERFSGGEISSANYLARAFGVRAGMWTTEARALCPRLVLVPYEFERYVGVARALYEALHALTPHVAAVSCDEAYVDCTGLVRGSADWAEEALALAHDVRERVRRATAGCCASVGVGPNRLLARIATAAAKPDGARTLRASDAAATLAPMPVRELPSVGPKRAARLHELGVRACADVRAAAASGELARALGAKAAAELAALARGEDPRPWPAEGRKSLSAQASWGVRFATDAEVDGFARQLCDALADKAARARVCGARHVGVHVWEAKAEAEQRYQPKGFVGHGDCHMRARAETLRRPLSPTAAALTPCALALVRALGVPPARVRGMRVELSQLSYAAHAARRSPDAAEGRATGGGGGGAGAGAPSRTPGASPSPARARRIDAMLPRTAPPAAVGAPRAPPAAAPAAAAGVGGAEPRARRADAAALAEVPRFGGGGGGLDASAYFQGKRQRTREALNEPGGGGGGGAAAAAEGGSALLRGVTLWVDGLTTPPADALRLLVLQHGGAYAPAGNFGAAGAGVTHIVCESVRAGRADALARRALARGGGGARRCELVRPQWLLESIAAGRRLPECEYALEGLLDPRQRTLALGAREAAPAALSAGSERQPPSSPPARERGGASGARDELGSTAESEDDAEDAQQGGTLRDVLCMSQVAVPPLEQLDMRELAQLPRAMRARVRHAYEQRGHAWPRAHAEHAEHAEHAAAAQAAQRPPPALGCAPPVGAEADEAEAAAGADGDAAVARALERMGYERSAALAAARAVAGVTLAAHVAAAVDWLCAREGAPSAYASREEAGAACAPALPPRAHEPPAAAPAAAPVPSAPAGRAAASGAAPRAHAADAASLVPSRLEDVDPSVLAALPADIRRELQAALGAAPSEHVAHRPAVRASAHAGGSVPAALPELSADADAAFALVRELAARCGGAAASDAELDEGERQLTAHATALARAASLEALEVLVRRAARLLGRAERWRVRLLRLLDAVDDAVLARVGGSLACTTQARRELLSAGSASREAGPPS